MAETRTITLVLCTVAALALGSCGDEGGDPLTEEQFLEQGNAICDETTEEIDQAATTAFSEEGVIPPADEISAFASNTVVPRVQDEIDRLGQLEPPEDDAERVEDILEAGQEGVDQIRQDPTIILSSADDGLDRYRELASDYGLEGCGGISPDTRNAIAGLGPPE